MNSQSHRLLSPTLIVPWRVIIGVFTRVCVTLLSYEEEPEILLESFDQKTEEERMRKMLDAILFVCELSGERTRKFGGRKVLLLM